MKMYDSLKTINFTHKLMQKLNKRQQEEFSALIRELFDRKQISEEGQFSTFLITQKDVEDIYQETFGL